MSVALDVSSNVFLASYFALWVVVLALAVGLWALYHHFGSIYLNSAAGRVNQGPPLDETLPARSLRGVDGLDRTVPTPGVPTMLLFTSVTCAPCASLRDRLARMTAPDVPLRLLVVCAGPAAEAERWMEPLPPWIDRVVDERGRNHGSLRDRNQPLRRRRRS